MTPREILALCREKDVQAVDLRFADLLGGWRRFTIPVGRLSEAVFEEGLGFDGSSLPGWQAVHESDMLALPQPDTAFLDPTAAAPTLVLICNVQDPLAGEPYPRDPRSLAIQTENYLRSTGIADTACFGPEAEFFVFNDVRFDQNAREAFFRLDSAEGEWNRGADAGPNLGGKLRFQEGYLAVGPGDQLGDLRTEMMHALLAAGLEVETHHHEVATAGQCEIDLRYQPLTTMGDWVQIYKYIVRNVAARQHKTATFMPKPVFGDNGSGMHVHFSFWKNGENLFAGHGYAGLSDLALYALGGVLRHAPALLALTNPTTNSYKRLTPGFEAPVHLVYSQRNRSAACRIPMYSTSPEARRIEFRCPDPSCNPYLAFAAVTLAALDGIQRKLSPGKPVESNLYALDPADLASLPHAPDSLEAALAALEADHDFLLRGEVFTPDLIAAWIAHKRRHEADAVRLRPHPYEFCLYYDV